MQLLPILNVKYVLCVLTCFNKVDCNCTSFEGYSHYLPS